MRWVIAQANHCEYSQQVALQDLRTSGATPEDVAKLTSSPENWSDDEKEPLRFAKELTLNASQIDDALFESLRQRFGDHQVAAMVLLGAYTGPIQAYFSTVTLRHENGSLEISHRTPRYKDTLLNQATLKHPGALR